MAIFVRDAVLQPLLDAHEFRASVRAYLAVYPNNNPELALEHVRKLLHAENAICAELEKSA